MAENVWKVLLHYADVDLRDMLSLRSTCRQAYKAVTPWIKISTTRFEMLMKKIDSTNINHGLDQWLHLEKDIDGFIEMYVTKNEPPVLTGVRKLGLREPLVMFEKVPAQWIVLRNVFCLARGNGFAVCGQRDNIC